MTKQAKSTLSWAAGIVVTLSVLGLSYAAFAGRESATLEQHGAAIQELKAEVKTKAPQRELDEVKGGVKQANERLLLIMGRLGVQEK